MPMYCFRHVYESAVIKANLNQHSFVFQSHKISRQNHLLEERKKNIDLFDETSLKVAGVSVMVLIF